MDSNEMNKIAGAAIGALLVFLLLGFFSEQVFHSEGGGHHGEETLAFALEIEEETDAAPEEELSLAALAAQADVAAGEKIYAKCKSCHKIEDGANGVGPHLWGVVGREIAAVDGFGYSGALAGKDGVWDVETLSAFLENPSGWAPGTAMGYAGLKGADNRVNLIAYLNEAGGSNIDLVESAGGLEQAPAAEEAAEATEVAPAAEEAAEEEVAAADAAAEPEASAEAAEPEAPAEVAVAAPAAGLSFDTANGAKVYRKCRACHKIEDGANGVGPHLYNLVDRDIAGVEGYNYSDALAGMDGVWDLANLDAWLENPGDFAPGNKMGFAGLKDAQDRLDVVAYINEESGAPVDLSAAGGAVETAAVAPEPEAAPEPEPAPEPEATEETSTEEAAAEEAPVEEVAATEAGGEEAAAEAPAAEAPEATETTEATETAETSEAEEATELAAVAPEAAMTSGQYADLVAAADADAGAKIFRKCRACHNVKEGRNGVGPSLYGVVGADIAAVDGYRYSDALSAKDGAWTLDALMSWLENPKAFAEGTKMVYSGLKDAQDRMNVIQYLNESDGTPVPFE